MNLQKILLLFFFILAGTAFSDEPRPNILFLFADDLGWVDTSVASVSLNHASEFHETPQLEKLAREGMVFTHAYAQQNCMPTRVAFLSGQYAPASDVYNVGSLRRPLPEEAGRTQILPPEQKKDLNPASLSLAEQLEKAGYVTAYFGKTHGVEPAEKLSENHGGAGWNYTNRQPQLETEEHVRQRK